MAKSNAYVTLVSNRNYVEGAIALLNSLACTGTEADIVVMHTPSLPKAALGPLSALGARLLPAADLPVSAAFIERHERERLHRHDPFDRGKKPDFHRPLDNFAKLRLWELDDYETIIFLDADTLVLRNIDKLFAYPEFSAAPNVYAALGDFHRLNSGVFVAKPAKAMFERMVTRLDAPDAYWRRTDQTFLETFFPDWHGLPVFFNMLQYVWFNLPGLWDWRSVQVLHYQYEKPWETSHPKADRLRPLIDLWRAFRDGTDIPDVDGLPGPIAVAGSRKVP